MKNRLTIFFLSVGVLALLVFIVIGINHRNNVGERYETHTAAARTIEAPEAVPAVEPAHPVAEEPEAAHPVVEAPAEEPAHPAVEEAHPVVEEAHPAVGHDSEKPVE